MSETERTTRAPDGASRMVIAVKTTPTIVCPIWCVIDPAEHVADLSNQEGMVIHWSSDGDVRLAVGAYPDGTPDAENPPSVFVSTSGDGLPLDEAQRLGQALLTAVEQARS